jgi:hypothetical protein
MNKPGAHRTRISCYQSPKVQIGMHLDARQSCARITVMRSADSFARSRPRHATGAEPARSSSHRAHWPAIANRPNATPPHVCFVLTDAVLPHAIVLPSRCHEPNPCDHASNCPYRQRRPCLDQRAVMPRISAHGHIPPLNAMSQIQSAHINPSTMHAPMMLPKIKSRMFVPFAFPGLLHRWPCRLTRQRSNKPGGIDCRPVVSHSVSQSAASLLKPNSASNAASRSVITRSTRAICACKYRPLLRV